MCADSMRVQLLHIRVPSVPSVQRRGEQNYASMQAKKTKTKTEKNMAAASTSSKRGGSTDREGANIHTKKNRKDERKATAVAYSHLIYPKEA